MAELKQSANELENELFKNIQPDYNQNDSTKLDYIKNKPGQYEHYYFNLKEFTDAQMASSSFNHSVTNPSSNVYCDKINISIVLGLGGMDNGSFYNITNIPYQAMIVNEDPHLINPQNFKNIGISSSIIQETLGSDNVLWFDTMTTIHKDYLTYDTSNF